MYGTVMAFSRELNLGYIFGEDGEEYFFRDEHWNLPVKPASDLKVSFEASSGEAVNVVRN